ncbi:1384_t:CDS:1, partial [Dentiscutata erythropus]
VDVIYIEDSEEEWCSEDNKYEKNYEDKESYEDEIEKIDYKRTKEEERQWNA